MFTNTKYIVEITHSLPVFLRHVQLSEGCRSMWAITFSSTTPLQSADTFWHWAFMQLHFFYRATANFI